MQDIKIPEYRVIRSKRKTLSLIVTSEAKLLVRSPLGLSEKQVREFVALKNEWIVRKMASARKNLPYEKSYDEGEPVLYLGERYPLSYVEAQPQIIDLQDKIYVAQNYRNRIKEVLLAWYTVQGYKVIQERVRHFSKNLSLVPDDVKITKARRRWGSCSSKGSLCFSWRLMMAPLPVIDYVVIHEMVHLKIRDHSRRFWQSIENYLPGYRDKRKWLKDNEKFMRL